MDEPKPVPALPPVASTAATLSAGYSVGIVAVRVLSSVVDFAALYAVYEGVLLIMGSSMPWGGLWLMGALLVAYFPVMETAFGGSVGKLVTGIRVVNIRGERPAFWQALVRTLLRGFEVNPFQFCGIPAAVLVLVTPNRQRMGDLLARTYVLRRADVASLQPPGRVQPG